MDTNSKMPFCVRAYDWEWIWLARLCKDVSNIEILAELKLFIETNRNSVVGQPTEWHTAYVDSADYLCFIVSSSSSKDFDLHLEENLLFQDISLSQSNRRNSLSYLSIPNPTHLTEIIYKFHDIHILISIKFPYWLQNYTTIHIVKYRRHLNIHLPYLYSELEISFTKRFHRVF